MTWVWAFVGIIVAAVVVVIAGLAIVYGTMRRRHRRQLALQARQTAGFPAWAREHGYAYSAAFPESDVERLRGLGPLMPFSEFVFSRVEHVFRRDEHGRARYLMQLTIFADPGPTARAVSAMTVGVAEVAAGGKDAVTDARWPAGSRDEPSVHAHGRWVTSYLGAPLTLSSMNAVEERLAQHLRGD